MHITSWSCMNMYNLTWTKGPITTLGVTISDDASINLEQNFMPILKAMDNVLNMWHCCGLSLKGKVTILKSLALPKLQYVASILPVPHAVVELVDNMIIDFIWGKKKPKIKKDVIIQNIEDGGLKVPHFGDIVKTCKINWIK